jgi:hypothetical protein
MKRLIFASAVVVAALYSQVAGAAAPAQCFASSGAVFAAQPNATHASYIARERRSAGSGRCWYPDAFKAQTQGNEKPALRSVVATAETSALRPSITATARQSRATAIAATAEPARTAAAVPIPKPRTTAVEATQEKPRTAAVAPVVVQSPRAFMPATQIAVNAREFSRFVPLDEAPADFESRFSASGYKAQQ